MWDMNNQESNDQARLHFQKIAAQFTSYARSCNRALLEPLTESIRTLRKKGASFATISELLKRDKINVSRFVVARFCREQFGKKQSRRHRSSRAEGK